MSNIETDLSHIKQLLTNIEQRLASTAERSALDYTVEIGQKLDQIMSAVKTTHINEQEIAFLRRVIDHIIRSDYR